MESVNIPKAEERASPSVRYLHIAAMGLAATASVLGLAEQVVNHFQKPKAGPNQRTKFGTAMLGLTVLKTLPGIIKSLRTVAADAKRVKENK